MILGIQEDWITGFCEAFNAVTPDSDNSKVWGIKNGTH